MIDDFAPQGGAVDVARYHAAADRVFRAAGNQAGRGRLDSGANLRQAKPPRGLILSTGEEIPRGHSVRARILILELSKGQINATSLTACQQNAESGLYSEALGGFVSRLAGSYDEILSAFQRGAVELRPTAQRNLSHARTPEIVAELQASFELFLEFGQECGAIDASERQRLAGRCWEGLCEAAAAQTKHQMATEPVAKFLETLRALLYSGRAHLASRNGGAPDREPGSCGWRRVEGSEKWTPQGECIGWAEGDDIYLESTVAYRLVQVACRDAGETLAAAEQTLRKRLHEKKLLASIDEKRQTLTIRRMIAGSSKTVLHFLRSTVLPEELDGGREDDA